MLVAGRTALPFADGGEGLYRRYQVHHFVKGILSNIGLPFPNISVNRGSCSEPDDVLWDDKEERRFDGWGVLGFTVSEARMQLQTGDGRLLDFDLRHEPLDLNYSHSEIVCIKRDNGGEPNISRKVQKEYRARLSQAARLIIPAAAED
jgi:hypothetical protein